MIFFLYGADTFRSRQKLKEIKEKFKKDIDPTGLNLTVIDGAKTDMDSLNRQMSAAPFLAKRRMAVIENLFANKSEEVFGGLLGILKNEAAKADDPKYQTACVKVFWDSFGEAPKKTAPGYATWQFLVKQKFALPFDPQQGQALAYWVSEEFRKNGLVVGRGDIEKLISLVGPDSWLLKSEIDKLSAYAAAQANRQVTSPMIDLLVNAQFDDNIFKLVDAISQRQKALALKLINEQVENGVNEIYLLTMINRSFRILTMVKESPITQQAKLGLHPFVLKKAVSQCQRFESGQLKNIYQRLLNLDEQIKTGFGKPALLIDLFLASI